jgi:DNA-binding MltR family transcriptional regulator
MSNWNKIKKAYYQETFSKKYAEVIQSVEKSNNSYERALVGVEILNHLSRELLQKLIIEDESFRETIFDNIQAGPLSTFSSRISLMYGLSIIDKEHYENLRTVNKIRNIFAHFIHGLNFETPVILAEVNNLSVGEKFLELKYPNLYTRLTIERKFIINILALIRYFYGLMPSVQMTKFIHEGSAGKENGN